MNFFDNEYLKLTPEERIKAFNSGVFNEILEGYIKQFLKDEGIEIEDLHSKVRTMLDLIPAEQVIKL